MSDTTEEEIDRIVGGLTEGSKRKRGRGASAAVQVVPQAEAEPEAPPPAPEPPPPEPPRPAEVAAPAEADPEPSKRPITQEQLEALHQIVPDLPRPSENVKTLSSMISKYGIGSRPEFRLQVWRTWPKIFPGARKGDGFYDEYDQPIDEGFISRDYGGGTYLLKVVGPDPAAPGGMKHYDSVRVEIAGDPDYTRVPRGQQKADAAAAQPAQPQVQQQQFYREENPKVVEAALGVVQNVVEKEREEKRRLEDRVDKSLAEARQMLAPIVEAEQKRADDVVRIHQERSTIEQRLIAEKLEVQRASDVERERANIRELEALRQRDQERLDELRKQLDGARSEHEAVLRRIEQMENGRPSLGQELKGIIEVMRPPTNHQPDGGSQIAEKLIDSQGERHRQEMDALRAHTDSMIQSLRQVHERETAATRDASMQQSDRHRAEMDALRAQQADMLQNAREMHAREIASMREGQQRALEAEREQARHREARLEDQNKLEREERRRDQDLARERLDERDRAWKDRMDQQEQNLKHQWEARLAMLESSFTERTRYLNTEIERWRGEANEYRVRAQDLQDPLAQMERAAKLREHARDTLGLVDANATPSAASPSSGGIGLNGTTPSGFDMNEAIQTVAERGPELLQALGQIMKPSQQQPSLQPGQIVPTAQGQMICILMPDGSLKLTPYDQYMAQVRGGADERPAAPPLLPEGAPPSSRPGPSRSPQPQPQRRPGQPRPMAAKPAAPKPAAAAQGKPKRPTGSSNFSPIPNLAAGLSKPKPPWEPNEYDLPEGAPAHAEGEVTSYGGEQEEAVAASASQEGEPMPTAPVKMDPIQKQIAQMVAKLVHESITGGDDPEDFVNKVIEKNYPKVVLEGICDKSDQEILDGIAQVEPRSAGVSTPAGPRFVRESMALLRDIVKGS